MTELFASLLSYPTVIFTALLGIVLLYWLSVIVGALDIDLFEADADGILEGADGALEGAEGALEGADGALEGADGAVEGADGAVGAEGLLSALNLRRAPLTITFSAIVFFGWLASYFGMLYLGPLAASLPGWLVGSGILVLSVAISLPLASLATRPLEPVFKAHTGKRRKDFVGSVCVIRTGRADAEFGQAEIAAGTDHLVIPVRIDSATLARGDKALIVDYDAEREAYILEAYDEILNHEPLNQEPSPRARKTR